MFLTSPYIDQAITLTTISVVLPSSHSSPAFFGHRQLSSTQLHASATSLSSTSAPTSRQRQRNSTPAQLITARAKRARAHARTCLFTSWSSAL